MVNFGTFLSGQLILQHIPNFWRVPFECQLLKKSFEKMRKNLCSYVVLLCLWQLLNFSICSRCVKYALYYFFWGLHGVVGFYLLFYIQEIEVILRVF